MSVTFDLEKSFEFDGKTITQLELREPTVADIRKYGNPFSITSDGETKIDTNVVFTLISRLSQVPPAILEKNMTLHDFVNLQAVVLGFFG